jgi:NAD+ kinase
MGPVVILGDVRKRGVRDAVEETRRRLEREFGVAAIDLEQKLDLSRVGADWALVFGGDGAILGAARRMRGRPIPTLAVNFGRFGFLTEVKYDQLPMALDRVKRGEIQIRRRMRLTASLGKWRHHALNDVVVSGGVVGRMFRVSVAVSGRDAIRYAGDGVVLATPTGSTAYNMAAGGPILDPDLRAFVLTPLCAHTLSLRPIVLPAGETFEITVPEPEPGGLVAVDGQERAGFSMGQTLRVQAAARPFLLIRVGMRSHYDRLRSMLGWGGDPRESAPAATAAAKGSRARPAHASRG